MQFLVELSRGPEFLFFDSFDVINGNGHSRKEFEGNGEDFIGLYIGKSLDRLGN
jgi:hypothetical protein